MPDGHKRERAIRAQGGQGAALWLAGWDLLRLFGLCAGLKSRIIYLGEYDEYCCCVSLEDMQRPKSIDNTTLFSQVNISKNIILLN